ncbi:MAG: ATP-binding cassette domain-containing protein [Clostridium sp.]|nr:ATP-binding cassette domain-containing protein [Clostridium sp.]
MVVEIQGLVKTFQGKTAVDGVNLCVKEGDIFGLLGPNGAGKSTTLNTMLGLLKNDSGSVKLFGKEFSRYSKEIKQMIGYVPQDFAFFEVMSALDNVTYW